MRQFSKKGGSGVGRATRPPSRDEHREASRQMHRTARLDDARQLWLPYVRYFFLGPALLPILGCAPFLMPSDSSGSESVLSATVEAPTDTPDPDSVPTSSSSDVSVSTPGERTLTIVGQVGDELDYRLYSLGASAAGDEWTISPDGWFSGALIVALFDADMNLIRRGYFTGGQMTHVMHLDSSETYLGVMTPSGRDGMSFRLRAHVDSGHSVANARGQLVWLNFNGASNVRVNGRTPISFPAFDGTLIGDQYASQTQEIKDSIVAEMRADYAGYGVTIVTSDEMPEPAETHATVHFGGAVSGLLGLADSVDQYNADPGQQAVIYVESFSAYWTMKLSADEMGVMVANVASHELGHLLGLYHTADPDDVMDTTGTARQLAGSQSFTRAALEETVFSTGMEDSPALLEQIVGFDPGVAKSAVFSKQMKDPVYYVIRRIAHEDIPTGCGTCLALDAE